MLKIILTLCLFFIFSQVNAQNDPPNLEISPFHFETKDGQSILADKGVLYVLENRLNPESRQIPIDFIRFKTKSLSPNSPIIYLAGGPGVSGISAAKGRLFPFLMELTKLSDVIVFDQRGTGNGAMPCPEVIQLPTNRAIEYIEFLEIASQKSLSCKNQWEEKGYDLNGYNTIESAFDVDDLRQSLKYQKVSLIGSSYGSHFALSIMKLFENHVDRVAISGIEGGNHTLKLPSYYDNHFEKVNSLIQKDEFLKTKIPDLKSMLKNILATLESNPKTVSVNKGNNEVTIGKFDVLLQVIGTAGRGSSSASIPKMIYKMHQGDFTQIAERAYQFRTRGLRFSAVRCQMIWHSLRFKLREDLTSSVV